MALPTRIALEIVTPEGLLLRDEVDELIAPGSEGYFGVRPGHTPMLAVLGLGELSYRKAEQWHRITCFSGWCEVLPERVNVLAEMGERGDEIDVARAEQALRRAEERMRMIKDEEGYDEVHLDYVRAVTRLAVARRERGA
jgi:F-type H+-transporting ATPase subunit epsilon